MKYKDIEFKFDDDLQNYTVNLTDRFQEIAMRISSMEAEFEDKMIRKRLIELGWAPPEDQKRV